MDLNQRGKHHMNATTRRITGQPIPAREISRPTAERLAKANGHFSVGDDKQGRVVITMRDEPLARLFAKQVISGIEYTALQKYKHHWYHAGLEASLGSADLNRVFSSDPGSMSGMAKTEKQVHHRRQTREANEALGHRTRIVVEHVVCQDHTLEMGGSAVGWGNKAQAVAAATEMVRDAGYRLAKLWGLG